jgi:hypothetical protein
MAKAKGSKAKLAGDASTKALMGYSEQDTADKLVLPYLNKTYGFPPPDSLDYQAQHTVAFGADETGRYDGMYLSGGYPYAILEAKKYSHDLTPADMNQARQYATGKDFDKPVPILIISNGREHQFFKRTTELNPADGLVGYAPIPATTWKHITEEAPGEVRRVLGEAELVQILIGMKKQTFSDVSATFMDDVTGKYDLTRQPQLGKHLATIVEDRKKYIGQTTSSEQTAIRFAIEAISLHFTIKILFIKLIEDLSTSAATPRVIHSLFPRPEYDLIGGLFGFKVLNSLDHRDERDALRLYVKSKRFYRALGRDIANVSWQDIFRYGFNIHTAQYGKLFKAANYDRFLPSEKTLEIIRDELIKIDIRSAVLYGKESDRLNVIGKIYERLIDDELRDSIGAVYTPDATMKFMVALGHKTLGRFRGHKLLEPACGSGHFYRQLYRDYVDEIVASQKASGHAVDHVSAHHEALAHVYGRDIDPFAVQLTLLGAFLEQLKDNVRPTESSKKTGEHASLWDADRSVDTQNSLDPITVDPSRYFDIEKTLDLHEARSRLASCVRALNPDLIIGNPPYGVNVVEGAHYGDIYDLSSKDSYGYFIVNALKRLAEGRSVVFIVSSSFLTIVSHYKLRKFILANAKVKRVIKLNRSTFPGIDIFPVIIELEKCSDPKSRTENVYQFYDFWQLHPVTDEAELSQAYTLILADLTATKSWPSPPTRTARYTVRQGAVQTFSRLPIFEARVSLYEYMRDVFASPPQEEPLHGSKKMVRPATVRNRKLLKLSTVAEVKIGLQSGNNRQFYRIAKGVSGGAVKGGYQEINPKQVVSAKCLESMTAPERENGFEVDDPSTGKYFVPLDKAAEADIEGGFLPMFSSPVDFFIDWSAGAVSEMKTLSGARFQNSAYYFRRGVSFSNTGLYSPTFRLGHGGVFDQKGSCVFSDFYSAEFLVGLLSSTLMRYFAKSFINHGVDAQLDDLPIVLPTAKEIADVENKVAEITKEQANNPHFDYRPKLAELDQIVFAIYQLTADEQEEIQDWYRRHYPKLFQADAADL